MSRSRPGFSYMTRVSRVRSSSRERSWNVASPNRSCSSVSISRRRSSTSRRIWTPLMTRKTTCQAVGPYIGVGWQVKNTMPSTSPTQVRTRSQSMSRPRNESEVERRSRRGCTTRPRRCPRRDGARSGDVARRPAGPQPPAPRRVPSARTVSGVERCAGGIGPGSRPASSPSAQPSQFPAGRPRVGDTDRLPAWPAQGTGGTAGHHP